MEEIVTYIAQAFGVTDEQQFTQILQQIAPDEQSQQQLMQSAQEAMKQGLSPQQFGEMLMGKIQSAKKGGYLGYLKGKCPPGYEEYKSGGVFKCKKCGGKMK